MISRRLEITTQQQQSKVLDRLRNKPFWIWDIKEHKLTAILKEAWTIAQKTEDNREKIQTLLLAKDCYSNEA